MGVKVESVLKAYKAFGLMPAQRSWLDVTENEETVNVCACPIASLAVYNGVISLPFLERLKEDPAYRRGFAAGYKDDGSGDFACLLCDECADEIHVLYRVYSCRCKECNAIWHGAVDGKEFKQRNNNLTEQIYSWANAKFGEWYVYGFTSAVDGIDINGTCDRCNRLLGGNEICKKCREVAQGYNDGSVVVEAILGTTIWEW